MSTELFRRIGWIFLWSTLSAIPSGVMSQWHLSAPLSFRLAQVLFSSIGLGLIVGGMLGGIALIAGRDSADKGFRSAVTLSVIGNVLVLWALSSLPG